MREKEEKEATNDEIKYKVINSFYSNAIGFGFSSDDLYIDFAQYPAAVEGENWVNATRIFLTPTAFKENIKFLKDKLGDYEKEYGEIKLKEENSE